MELAFFFLFFFLVLLYVDKRHEGPEDYVFMLCLFAVFGVMDWIVLDWWRFFVVGGLGLLVNLVFWFEDVMFEVASERGNGGDIAG